MHGHRATVQGREGWAIVCGTLCCLMLVGCPRQETARERALRLAAEACEEDHGDADEDGEPRIECGGADCDDEDPRRSPMRTELCDEDDLDEDCEPTTPGTRDQDMDGYVDATCRNVGADEEATSHGLDCDDGEAGTHPGLLEACDGHDNDCDGRIDEGVVVASYPDADGDGFGRGEAEELCAGRIGYATRDGDCNDDNAQLHPDAFRCAKSMNPADIETCDHDGHYTADTCPDDGRCVVQPDGTGVCLPGASTTACSDMIDNDADGVIDWNDPECISPLDDSEGPRLCDNGMDDDGDTYADFPNDPGCRSPEDSDEVDPASVPLCANGLDDDADGTTDYAGGAGDLGCTSAADESERDPTAASCDNGVDDDTNGAADFPADARCTGPTDVEAAACSNGLDDDFDGVIDAKGSDPTYDFGCDNSDDDDERGPANGNYPCDNGIDDDLDGVADFPGDTGCSSVIDVTET